MLYLQYGSSFEHFRHERGHSFQLTIAGSNASQHSIDDRDLSLATRDKTAELSQQHHDTNLHTCMISHDSIPDLKSSPD